MKNLIIFFLVLLLSFPLFTASSKTSEVQKQQVNTNDSYIYVKHMINGTMYIFVYLSDGVTLVNIYEDED